MLNVRGLLEHLAKYEIQYVMFGTLATIAYGAELMTGDMDLCPALTADNLHRIAQLLPKIEARPRPMAGWMTDEESAAWRPDPPTVENLDHEYLTCLGRLDICPQPFGSAGKLNRFNYETLSFRAQTLTAYGIPFQVAHMDDVVASKTSARRQKDEQVYEELRRVQCTILQGHVPTDIETRFDLLHQNETIEHQLKD